MEQLSLKAARVDKGMSQAELGAAVGVAGKTVGHWESGRSKPSIDKAIKVCAALGRKFEEIRWPE